jgi:hypothetical protein
MAILAHVAEFLANLPEEHLDDLQSGAARLTLIPAGSDDPLPPPARAPRARSARERAPSAAVSEIAEAVRNADSREAAAAMLRPLKVADLKEIAANLGITLPGSATKERLTTTIVERAVGNRLDSLAIRGTATLPY